MPIFSRTSTAFSFALLSLTASRMTARTQHGALAFADKIRMVNCEPASNSPCFRLKLNAVDPQGAPMSLDLPSGAELAGSIRIIVDNQEIPPFYAAAEAAGSQTPPRRVALVLVDISGSMNARLGNGETRFATAKEALSRFLDSFEDGVDQVAIVPFESHNVQSTIRNAQFASSKRVAEQEVESLPAPARRNNTALYSSVVIGLDVLKRKVQERTEKASIEQSLIIMTDGKNEVFRGDDADLLDGPTGLETAASKVRDAGIQVIGIGFGNSGEIDETALTRISTKHYMASDAGKLSTIFAFARKLLNNRITVTFSSPWRDRASLSGRTVPMLARFKLASGDTLSSNQQTWTSPEMGVPVFEGKCDVAEMSAFIAANSVPAESDWMPILRPILVFVGLGALLLILWFWLPRLMWPERYLGIVPNTQRWMNTRTTKVGRGAPTGFRSDKAGRMPPLRTPSDKTIVQPRTEFTKTRLGRDV